MQKKWIAVLFALLLLLSGCGGGDIEKFRREMPTPMAFDPAEETPLPAETKQVEEMPASLGGKTSGKPDKHIGDGQDDAESSELAALRAEIAGSGALIGVAYLGYAQLPTWADVCVYVEAGGYCNEFPFLLDVTEDHAVLHEGGEIYVVVPVDKRVSLTVSELLMDETDYIPNRGKDLLTVTDGSPILLRGNLSEIVPNLLITAERGTEGIEYSPCLSGMDGSLVSGEGVYDFTPYDRIMGEYSEMPASPLTENTWYARHYDGDGEHFAMTLMLNRDGTAQYSYGKPDGDVLERFEGVWTQSGDLRLRLELVGGPLDAAGDPIPKEQHELSCDFSWDIQGVALVLCHEGDSPLLRGTEAAWYMFMPFDGFALVNNWTSLSKYRDWYYILQLIENGECFFSVNEMSGKELCGYEGFWRLEDEVLSLNMMRCRGEHPENPELVYFSGEYRVEHTEPTDMTLHYTSGERLSLDMAESGKAGFFGY